MLFDAVTAVGIERSYRTVVGALGSRKATSGEARRFIGLDVPEKIFLFETKPEIIIVLIDRSTTIRLVRRAISVQNFCHDQVGITPFQIGVDCNGFQEQVRVFARRLLSGTAVE